MFMKQFFTCTWLFWPGPYEEYLERRTCTEDVVHAEARNTLVLETQMCHAREKAVVRLVPSVIITTKSADLMYNALFVKGHCVIERMNDDVNL